MASSITTETLSMVHQSSPSGLPWLRLLAVLLTLALALTACLPPPAPAPAPAEVCRLATPVTYSRSGGIAGLIDLVEIARDGSYTVTRRNESSEGALTLDQICALRDALAGSGLFAENHEYRAVGADLFLYVINYSGHTVSAMDTAVPAALTPALQLLNALIE